MWYSELHSFSFVQLKLLPGTEHMEIIMVQPQLFFFCLIKEMTDLLISITCIFNDTIEDNVRNISKI